MKRSRIKLIVCDVDGTLLDNEKNLDQNIISVVNKLRKMNVQFTLATGRNEAIVKDYIDLLQIDIPYATDNGANLYYKHQLMDSFILNQNYIKIIVEELMEQNIPFTLFDKERGYSFSNSKKIDGIRKLFDGNLIIKEIDSSVKLSELKVYKLTMDIVNYQNIDNLISKITSLCPSIYFKQSEDTFYTITAQGVNKGSALEMIANYLNIGLSETMSIGDNFNDISMFEKSGFSVAMGNSDPRIRKFASAVALANNENGVSKYLMECFLKE